MLRRSSVFLSEKWKSSYCVWLFAAPWIAACQAHLSMEFSRQEYWNHSFLQGIFTTQGWNSGLPFCTWILYHLSHQGSPRILEWVSISFFRWSSWPRDRICVSRIGRWILYHWVTREAPDFGICWFCSVTKSCPTLCCSMTAACQASLSFTVSQTLLKLMSTESVILSIYLILCLPLLHMPSIIPSIRVFSNESAFHIRWERGMVIHSSTLAWRIPWTEEPGRLQSLGS